MRETEKMSKAFTKEDSEPDTADEPEEADELPPLVKNYMTPDGYAALQKEFQQLARVERPKIVETVSWAASNGDRSENGDYIYGKKRLREIDRRLRYLTRRLDNAEVVDPARQQGLDRIFFGATVTYMREDETQHTVTLVGLEEADVQQQKISWISPVAKTLMKAREGDTVELRTPGGRETLEVLEIRYGKTSK